VCRELLLKHFGGIRSHEGMFQMLCCDTTIDDMQMIIEGMNKIKYS